MLEKARETHTGRWDAVGEQMRTGSRAGCAAGGEVIR